MSTVDFSTKSCYRRLNTKSDLATVGDEFYVSEDHMRADDEFCMSEDQRRRGTQQILHAYGMRPA